MSFDTDFDAAFDSPPQDETTAILIKARDYIERGWCRYAIALTATGCSVDPTDRAAVKWCATGALIAAGMLDDDRTALRRLMAAVGGTLVSKFNNQQETVEPVLAAFDRAIAGEPSASQAGEASSAGGAHGGHEEVQGPNRDN